MTGPYFSNAVITLASSIMDIPVADIMSKRRFRPATRARQAAIYVIRKVKGMSYPMIGAKFGRDHSTCMHAIDACEALAATDPVFAGRLAAMMGEATAIKTSHRDGSLARRIARARLMPEMIQRTAVCDLLLVSLDGLLRLAESGRLPPPVKICGRYYYDRDAVVALIEGAVP